MIDLSPPLTEYGKLVMRAHVLWITEALYQAAQKRSGRKAPQFGKGAAGPQRLRSDTK